MFLYLQDLVVGRVLYNSCARSGIFITKFTPMASLAVFRCPNPQCSSGNVGFPTQSGLLAHLRLSEVCQATIAESSDVLQHKQDSCRTSQDTALGGSLTSSSPTLDISQVQKIAGALEDTTLDRHSFGLNETHSGGAPCGSPVPPANPITTEQNVLNMSALRDETGSPAGCNGSSTASQDDYFQAADFEEFSSQGEDIVFSDSDSSTDLNEEYIRQGFLDAALPHLPFVATGYEPLAQAFVSNDPNLLAYESLEKCMAESQAQKEIIRNSVEHCCVSDLVSKLELARSPDYLLKTVLSWARKSMNAGFDFHPTAVGRKENLRWMYRMLPNSAAHRPSMVDVCGLESHGPESFTRRMATFDYASQISSLLLDPDLMQPQWLNLNPTNPLSMFQPPDGCLGEPMSGSVAIAMYQGMDPAGNKLLVPPILFIDGTQFTSKGNREMIPVTMTLAIFNITARRQRKFWRLLGYIPDPHLGESADDKHKSTNKASGYAVRNFHRCMKVMLQGMASCHHGVDTRLQGVFLKLFEHWHTVDVETPLLTVINDGKQGDQGGGRFSNHSTGLVRHYRYCDCDFDNLANPNHRCNPITEDHFNHVAKHGTDEECRLLSTYRHDNAFSYVDRGPQSVLDIFPPEVMHSIEGGVIPLSLLKLNNALLPDSRNHIDVFGKSFALVMKQQILKTFPRMSFVHGVTSLTNLSCSEKVGMLFIYTASLCFSEVQDAFDDGFSRKRTEEYKTMSAVAVRDVLERLLIYHSWLQQHSYWEVGDTVAPRRFHNKIQKLMAQLQKALPTPADAKGHGWNVSKMHEQLHIIEFMKKLGATIGTNASTGEKNHKAFAKDKAAKSSNCHATLEEQTANRVADGAVIETVDNILNPPCPEEPGRSAKRSFGTSFCLNGTADEGDVTLEWVFNTKTSSGMVAVPGLGQFLVKHFGGDRFREGIGTLWCRTEHRWEVSDGQFESVRCHPNYNSGGSPHYDWGYIKFEDETEAEYFPSRVVAVIDKDKNQLESTFLVVQCCVRTLQQEARKEKRSEYVSRKDLSAAKSQLFNTWMFDASTFYVVPLESYSRPCLVFWNPLRNNLKPVEAVAMKGVTRVVVCDEISDWPDKF